MESKILVKHFIKCPNDKCDNDRFGIDHLNNGFQSQWACELCHVNFKITKNNDMIDTEIVMKRKAKKVLIKLDVKKNEDVLFEATMIEYNGEGEESSIISNVEQHTCPLNVFMRLDEIYVGGEADPHGILKIVKITDEPEGDKEDNRQFFQDEATLMSKIEPVMKS